MTTAPKPYGYYTIKYFLIAPNAKYPREIQLKANSKKHARLRLENKINKTDPSVSLEIVSVE